MIEQLKRLAVGEAHPQHELLTIDLTDGRFSELHNATTVVRDRTTTLLSNTMSAINTFMEDLQRGPNAVHADLLPRFEVNTHQIMSIRTRHKMHVQIVVSVLRVK